MAILVITQSARTHTKATRYSQTLYERGDIIHVQPDSAHDGDVVTNPIRPGIYLLHVNGLAHADALTLTRVELLPEELGRGINKSRAVRIMFDELPAGTLSDLARDRYASITVTQFRAVLETKATGARG